MQIEIKKKSKHLIARTDRKKGGGLVRIDEGACIALERLVESVGGNVSISKLTSELIKQAAKDVEIVFKE